MRPGSTSNAPGQATDKVLSQREKQAGKRGIRRQLLAGSSVFVLAVCAASVTDGRFGPAAADEYLSGSQTISNTTYAGETTTGGDGSGGGGGLGGAVFIGNGATVTFDSVDFLGNTAIGGTGVLASPAAGSMAATPVRPAQRARMAAMLPAAGPTSTAATAAPARRASTAAPAQPASAVRAVRAARARTVRPRRQRPSRLHWKRRKPSTRPPRTRRRLASTRQSRRH